VLAEHLGDGQHQVGRGGPGRQLTVQFEPDDARDEHRHRLAEHGRLRLDAADAPAQHAQPVDHGGVAVRADQRVRVRLPAACHHHSGQVLDVHLVHDAGPRRHHLELVERGLAPAQELVALAVALVLQVDVALEGVRPAEDVGDHRVVDHQLGRGQRVDLGRVAAELGDGLAHGGQVHDARHAGEVLHHDAAGGELDLHGRFRGGVPTRQRAHVIFGDVRAVLGAQQVLQQDLQAVRQALRTGHRAQPEHLVRGRSDGQRAPRAEAVLARWCGHIELHLAGERTSVSGSGTSLAHPVTAR
jgi:hypothetical protein